MIPPTQKNKALSSEYELEKAQMIASIIDDTKEKYCDTCFTIHPINYYYHLQTGILVDTCKVIRLKNSKTKGTLNRKYDEKKLRALIGKDGGELIDIKWKIQGHITTKTRVTLKCGECGEQDEKAVNSIENTGGICVKCTHKNANRKRRIFAANTTKKRKKPTVNKESYIKNRKYTVEDVENILNEQGAVLIKDDLVSDQRISTKMYVNFICATDGCCNVRKKQIREFRKDRGGAYCLQCTAFRKSSKISDIRMRPPQIVTDPTKEKICIECKWKKNIEEFNHDQSDCKQTSLCQRCRDQKKIRDKRQRELRKLTDVTDINTQQKCTSCYRIRDKKDDFCLNNKTCNYCRKYGKQSYINTKNRLKTFNDSHDDEKICARCINKLPIEEFDTFVNGRLGAVCITCQLRIFNYKDEIADMYLELKKGEVCVDCGIDDVRILEFDHVDRELKLYNMSDCRSIKLLLEEVEKCVLRCGICHRRRTKTQRNYGINITKRHHRYVNDIKKQSGGCASCEWFDIDLLEALEFDHIDKETKLGSISTMVSNSVDINIIMDEIEKCQILCVHCHKLKTIEDNGYYMYKDMSRMDCRILKSQENNESVI